MTSVEFEKMLSARPTETVSLRDLIFDYYYKDFGDEIAERAAKEYTDALAQMMGVK